MNFKIIEQITLHLVWIYKSIKMQKPITPLENCFPSFLKLSLDFKFYLQERRACHQIKTISSSVSLSEREVIKSQTDPLT